MRGGFLRSKLVGLLVGLFKIKINFLRLRWYFLRLGAFRGDLKEGVHCLWGVGINNM